MQNHQYTQTTKYAIRNCQTSVMAYFLSIPKMTITGVFQKVGLANLIFYKRDHSTVSLHIPLRDEAEVLCAIEGNIDFPSVRVPSSYRPLQGDQLLPEKRHITLYCNFTLHKWIPAFSGLIAKMIYHNFMIKNRRVM